MSKERIEKALHSRFAAPLRDCHKRRILFWQDPDQAFGGMIDVISVPGIKVLKLTGSNNFAAKQCLLADDPDSDYLVYNPVPCSDIRDNWLLDIECYSEEFRADLLSMRIDELGLPATAENRNAVRQYSRFFDNKERVAKLRRFGSDYAHPGQLHIDIIAALCDTADNTVPGIIRAVLSGGLEGEHNAKLQSIARFGSMEMLEKLIFRDTGYPFAAGRNLHGFAAHLLFTAFSVTAGEGLLQGLEAYVSAPHAQTCYLLVSEWLRSDGDEILYEIAREIERDFSLKARFSQAELSALLGGECFPCIHEQILCRFMTEIVSGIIKPDAIIEAVEKRRTMKWYDRVRYYYEGLLQAAKMQQFKQEHAAGFHLAEHTGLWAAYTEQYYMMDTYYRRFHAAFGKSLRQSCTALEDLFKGVADYVEKLYKNWYLASVCAQWTALTREEFEKSPQLAGIPQQTDFYQREILPLGGNSRVYVIISDALRYEAAVELTERLNAENKGQAAIGSMQSILPSITKFGMAALLPHDRLQLENDMTVSCDSTATDNTVNREKILRRAEPESVALTYKTLLAMKQSEKRERVNGTRVVYIYHDVIDAIGEQRTTENQVFEACETAVSELVNLVRVIANELSGTNILITADHGFLYSYQPLEESDKAEKSFVSGQIYELSQRYLIADAGCDAVHMIRSPLEELAPGKVLLAPQDAIRIKKQGGNLNYVHGGISLQELVLPVISYKSMRTASKKFVDVSKAELQLISQSRKISNSIFGLEFYQKEVVGGKIVPAAYEIYLCDAAGNAVSDRQLLIADKTSDSSADRLFQLRFALKNRRFDPRETYFLTIAEKGSSRVCERIAFTINIAFAQNFD